MEGLRDIPDCPGLQLDRRTGDQAYGEHVLLAAVLDVLRHGGEGTAV